MEAVEGGGGNEEQNTCVEENHLDLEILKLRGRWELASVLNFLDVSFFFNFVVKVIVFYRLSGLICFSG